MRILLIPGGVAALSAALLILVPPGSAQDFPPPGPPFLPQPADATSPPPPPQPEQAEPGAEVQTRGPIHESFAQPSDPKPDPGPLIPRQPPAPIPEEPPPERPEGNDVAWIGGYWYWDPDRNDFLWVSGVYRRIPPGRRWIPGYWGQEGTAYRWTPGFWGPEQQAEIPYDPPPPEPIERGPSLPAPDAESIYVPGIWVYRDTRYLWRPGFCIRARPGWIWVAPRYVCTPGGWIFVDGYWDHPLEDRGLLFAPVYYSRPVYLAPSYCYRPRFVVNVSVVLGSLFISPHRHCYVYGDYYGAAYVRIGYRPWCDWGPRYHDPLFSYYRFHYRNQPGWHADLRFVYSERLAGRMPRPPRTLVQQTTIVKNTTINNVTVNNIHVNKTNVVNRSLEVARPLSQVARTPGARFTSVPVAQVKAEAAAARQLRDAGQTRQRFERELAATRGQNAEPRRVTLDTQKFKLPAHTKAALSPTTKTGNPARTDTGPGPGLRNSSNLDRPRPSSAPGKTIQSENPPGQPGRANDPPFRARKDDSPSPGNPPKNVTPFRQEPPRYTPPSTQPPTSRAGTPPAPQYTPPSTQAPLQRPSTPPAPKYTPPSSPKPKVSNDPPRPQPPPRSSQPRNFSPPAQRSYSPPAQPRSFNPAPAQKHTPVPARASPPPARPAPAPSRPAPTPHRPAVRSAPRSSPAPARSSAPPRNGHKKR